MVVIFVVFMQNESRRHYICKDAKAIRVEIVMYAEMFVSGDNVEHSWRYKSKTMHKLNEVVVLYALLGLKQAGV